MFIPAYMSEESTLMYLRNKILRFEMILKGIRFDTVFKTQNVAQMRKREGGNEIMPSKQIPAQS